MLKRAIDVLTRFGFAILIKKAFSKVLRRRSHELFTLDCTTSEMPASAAQIRIQVLRATDIQENSAICQGLVARDPENEDYLDDVQKGRAVGLVLFYGNAIAHSAFLFKENKTARILGLPLSAALIGNAYTAPEFRGKGLQGLSVQARAALAREEGFSAVVSETSPDNEASKQGLKKGGMTAIGKLELLVIFDCIVIRWKRPSGYRAIAFLHQIF